MKEKEITKPFLNSTIPGDWEVMHFEDVADIDKESLNGDTPKDYEFDYISLSDVDCDDLKIETTKQVFADAPSRARRIVKKGDVLMSTVRPNLQGFSLIRDDVKNLIASTGFAVITTKKCDNEFLYQYLFSTGISRQFYRLLVGSNYPAINSSDVRKLKIPLPPLPEQKAIAHILNLMDSAINKNNLMFAKKEMQKKWLMQNLLTGKKRLKGGVEGEWKEVKLGDIGKIKMCKRVFNHETKNEGDIPFYKIGTFGKIADAFIPKELYNEYKTRFSFPNKGDILISAAGTLGRTVIYDGSPAYFQDSNIVWISNDESKALNEYLFYVYKIIRYDSEGGTIQRLYNSIISNGKFNLPSIEEQTAIAQVLQAADKEIQLLKTKTGKLREKKKGLMQQLLTGKKRLKV